MTTEQLWGTSLVASFLGSLHCAAMCGGLVSALSLAGPGQPSRPARALDLAQFVFHGGRLLVYLSLGAVAGLLGQALNLAGNHAGVAQAAALVSGGLVLLAGLAGLATAGGVRLPRPKLGARLLRSCAVAGLKTHRMRGAFALGVAASLLPCGWLYAFVISAAGTGSVAQGAAVMAAFWLGGMPALVGVGTLVSRLATPLKRHVPLLGAALLIFLGLGAIFGRLNLPAEALQEVSSALDGTSKPPCH